MKIYRFRNDTLFTNHLGFVFARDSEQVAKIESLFYDQKNRIIAWLMDHPAILLLETIKDYRKHKIGLLSLKVTIEDYGDFENEDMNPDDYPKFESHISVTSEELLKEAVRRILFESADARREDISRSQVSAIVDKICEFRLAEGISAIETFITTPTND